MNVTVQITPSAELQGLFKRAASLPQESLKAIARALTVGGEIIEGNMKQHRFVLQKGPFPVSENKLGKVSGRLNESIRATAPQIQEGSSTVTMRFGSNVKSKGGGANYFLIHEFGFSGQVGIKAHTRKNGVAVRAHNRLLKVPAREPMQTELRHPRTTDVIMTLVRREIAKVITDIEKGGPA